MLLRALGVERAVIEDVRWESDGNDAALVVRVRPTRVEAKRCAKCGRRCSRYDSGDGLRRWRASDVGLLRTYVEAEAPRVRCPIHGVGVQRVAWARSGAGFTRAFEKHLDLPAGTARKGIVAFGVVGYVAKGIAVAVTGILFVVAALTHDTDAAGGLDSALHTLAALPFGPLILWVVGGGLIVYGLFCFARARYARM